MRTLIRAVPLLLLATALAPSAQVAEAMPTTSLPGPCALAPTVNTWQGLGINPARTDQWEDGDNWSTGFYPGSGPGDDDACIPTGGVPRIRAGEEEQLTTLDVDSGATLTVDPGGKLFLYGDQATDQDSVVRAGGRLDVVGGSLGGIAKLHVVGTLVLENDGTGAPTVLTRDCSYDTSPGPAYPGEESCPPATPVSGPTFLLEVADLGELDVHGGGVNFGDQATAVVRGLARVRDGAYVAADHGTRLELRPQLDGTGAGTLRFEGDGGYLEGKIESDTGIAALSTLVDQGTIVKSGGTGRTLVSANYSQPTPGAVSVLTGTLLLPTGTTTPAYVDGGVRFGTGRCTVALTPTCATTTVDAAGFRQNADFRVPSTDTSGARVVVRQLASRSSVDLGYPFEVHATSLAATASSPAIVRLRLDASVLRGKRWPTVKVYRKSGTAAYALVKACLSNGRPPTGQVACVDRRGLSGSSRDIANASGAPDVLMVIRTTRTSRWVGRSR